MTDDSVFKEAIIAIKDAIVRSRYQAATLVNKELLSLYYGVGKYVSENSRDGYWGQGAIKRISESLQRELPGLRGFSESSIKRMRQFYEEWQPIFGNRPTLSGELSGMINRPMSSGEMGKDANRPLIMGDLPPIIDLNLLSIQAAGVNIPQFSDYDFFRIGFYHHSEILAK
ncbi:MAG: DUF1016 N-terminal domain-containing protein, partial [Synergistaceae bacterium]|nr:DUF1016 N-terminal domain-containing protein [Synergistaceae bacterium]